MADKVSYCYECDDFPCKNLERLDKGYRAKFRMSMIENLGYIKKNGMKQFLESQKDKWRCPDCNGVICCHNGICFNCGLDTLREKKNRYRWE